MNLLDTLTLLAGMYGRYRTAKEERTSQERRAAEEQITERGKTAAYEKVGLAGAQAPVTIEEIRAGTARGQQATDLAKAAIEAQTRGYEADVSRYVQELATLTGYDIAAMTQIFQLALAQAGYTADERTYQGLFNWLNAYGPMMVREGARATTGMLPGISALSAGKEWKAPAAGQATEWTTQARPGDTPADVQNRRTLVSLYNQLNASGQGAIVKSMIAAFGTETPREQLETAIAQAQRALGGYAPMTGTGGAGEFGAGPPPFEVSLPPLRAGAVQPPAIPQGLAGILAGVEREVLPEISEEALRAMTSQGMTPRARVRRIASGLA